MQEMEEARAALAAALEPSRSAGVASLFVQEGTKKSRSADDRSVNVNAFDHLIAVPALERAVARARASAWPWQLADAVADAEATLERWRAIGRVRDAIDSRDVAKIRREIAYARKAHPEVETRGAERALAEMEAEDALEGGDRRLKAYFAASKMAWSSGAPSAESAEMLRTIRDSLAVTDAEHEQVTKAVSAGSRTAAEETRARARERERREFFRIRKVARFFRRLRRGHARAHLPGLRRARYRRHVRRHGAVRPQLGRRGDRAVRGRRRAENEPRSTIRKTFA